MFLTTSPYLDSGSFPTAPLPMMAEGSDPPPHGNAPPAATHIETCATWGDI